MKRQILFIVFILNSIMLAQTTEREIKEGSVTFISSQNIYVKFENTDGLEAHDTLYIKSGNEFIPALIIRFISSSSSASEKITTKEFNTGDEVYAFARIYTSDGEVISTTEPETSEIVSPLEEKPVQSNNGYILSSEVKEVSTKIHGRLSTQSYSNFANYNSNGNYQRWRHSFRFNADHIGGSGLSFSSYSNFAYKDGDWNRISSNIGNALKVYDLNIGYKFDETTRVWLGRYLNRRISNISTVDGIQFEKILSSFAVGLVAGSRPNFSDFGYNLKLFEYGAYVSKSDSIGEGRMENTISLFEQTNNFKTDRRFLYLQHNNNAIKNTSFFVSSEIDLFKKILNNEENSATLTSVFVSARYSPIRELSFSVSYDARKNVIYYETFKSFIDSVFENETRQGFRFRTNIRPFRNFSVGLNYGYRNKKSDPKPNTNYGAFLNYSLIPFTGLSSTVTFNRLNSSYIEGNIYGVSLSRSIDLLYLDVFAGVRLTEYKLLPDRGNYNEKSLLIDLSTAVLNPIYLNVGYEGIFQKKLTSGRILFNISYRF